MEEPPAGTGIAVAVGERQLADAWEGDPTLGEETGPTCPHVVFERRTLRGVASGEGIRYGSYHLNPSLQSLRAAGASKAGVFPLEGVATRYHGSACVRCGRIYVNAESRTHSVCKQCDRPPITE